LSAKATKLRLNIQFLISEFTHSDVVTAHGSKHFGAFGWLKGRRSAVGPEEKNQADSHQRDKSKNQHFAGSFKPP